MDLEIFNVHEAADRIPDTNAFREACRRLDEQMANFGLCLIRDERVWKTLASQFMDLMAGYYELTLDEKKKDIRPDGQAGYHEAYLTERAKPLPQWESGLQPEDRPCKPDHRFAPSGYEGFDPKERFFFRLPGMFASAGKEDLDQEPVFPNRPGAEEISVRWMQANIAAGKAFLRMLAIGARADNPDVLWDGDAFLGGPVIGRMEGGPHILGSTGVDLRKHNLPGTAVACRHADLNDTSVHWRATHPGMFAWDRKKRRHAVRVPDGCFLVQAGYQLERKSAYRYLAGIHEVIVTPEALDQVRGNPSRPIRTSSNAFLTNCYSSLLAPVGPYRQISLPKDFRLQTSAQQIAEELSQNAMSNYG